MASDRAIGASLRIGGASYGQSTRDAWAFTGERGPLARPSTRGNGAGPLHALDGPGASHLEPGVVEEEGRGARPALFQGTQGAPVFPNGGTQGVALLAHHGQQIAGRGEIRIQPEAAPQCLLR